MNDKEAIEILRNECINTYAERKALAIQTVLNLIEKQKAKIKDWKMEYNHWCQLAIDRAKEIEALKRDFEIVDHECSRLEQEDIRKDKIINDAIKWIENTMNDSRVTGCNLGDLQLLLDILKDKK